MGATAAGQLAGVRVVLVDDEPDALEFLCFVLQNEGADVASFADPDAALRELTAHPPDLLLSDLYMPSMNGWELLERAREQGVRVPAVAITAHPSSENRARSLAVGYSLCIGKPVGPAELVNVVERLLAR